jgi:Tfp pilus assembly protein PilF
VAAGQAAKAVELHKETLKLRAAKLGPEHPNTLRSQNLLAVAYQAQGNLVEAESVYRAALQAARRALGAQHPPLSR